MKKRSSLKDVAQASGFSIASVATVLNNAGGNTGVSQATREHILAVAGKLDYRPNHAARSIRTNKSWQLGSIIQNDPVNNLQHPLAYEMLLGINMQLEELGYILCMLRVNEIDSAGKFRSRALREHHLDGLIVVNSLYEAIARRIVHSQEPVVWLDSQKRLKHNCIWRDEKSAGSLLAEHLLECGYERWVVIYREQYKKRPKLETRVKFGQDHFSFSDRLQGVEETARSNNIPCARFPLVWPRSSDYLSRFVDKLDPKCAIIALDIYTAEEFVFHVAPLGGRPGIDFGLACCDDNSNSAEYIYPHMTRMRFDRFEMGRSAARMLVQRIEQTGASIDSQIVAPSLITGTMTGSVG